MFKFIDKKIMAILYKLFLLNWPNDILLSGGLGTVGMHNPNLGGCFEGPSTVQFYNETNHSLKWNIFRWSFSSLQLIHSRMVVVKLQAKVCARSTAYGNRLCKLAHEKCVVR